MTEQNTSSPQTGPVDEVLVEVGPTPAEAREAAAKDVADKARAEYLAATAPTREKQTDDEKRYAAYDRRFLRFIEGTAATSTAKAKALAKDLGHEGDHIETRPV